MLDQVFSFSGQDEVKSENIKDILGLVEADLTSRLLDFIIKKQSAGAVKFLEQIMETGTDLQEFVKSFIDYLRQGMLLKIAGKENLVSSDLTKEEIQQLKKQVERMEQKQISQILESFLEANNRIRYSPIPQLPIELAIIESCQPD